MDPEVSALLSGLDRKSSPDKGVVLHKDGTLGERNKVGQADFAEYTDQVDSLFNDKPHFQAILRESPRHRLILWMTAHGHSPQQIATALGITKATVYTVRRQPWFRTMFVAVTTSIGKDSVTAFLSSEVMPSLEVLRDIRDNENLKAADRRAAADSLLDRFLGKATVKVDSGAKAPADVPSEVADLLAEKRRLDSELAARGLSQHDPARS